MPIQVATIETANHNQNEKEILIVDRTLNSSGANRSIIAVALDFQGWKTFYGGSERTEEYVNGLLDGFRVKETYYNQH